MRLHRVLPFVFLFGCDLVGSPPTKVGKGELYQAGDGRFDPYLQQVHQEQLGHASWADESKQSRRGIITALALKPGASNSIILGAARDAHAAKASALAPTVEQTIVSERERAKKLAAAENRLVDLGKKGTTLKAQAVEDRENLGADKADEAKVKKRTEVKRELSAAVEAVDDMRNDAEKGSAEADELATKLRSLWTADETPAPPPKKPEPAATKPAKHPTPHAAPTTPSPPPEKKPAAGEVFNP